jgi:hypothetical protein
MLRLELSGEYATAGFSWRSGWRCGGLAVRRARAATYQATPHRIRSFRHPSRPSNGKRRSVLGGRFFETLRGLGDAEGVNLVVERYSAEGRSDRFGVLAAEAVSRNPDVIVSNLNDLVKTFARLLPQYRSSELPAIRSREDC